MKKQAATLERRANPVGQPVPAAPAAVTSVQPVQDAHSYESEIQDLIRRRAYTKWEAAGRPEGNDVRFWLEAEEDLLLGKPPKDVANC